MDFFVSGDRIQFFFNQREIKKISLPAQRPVVESFKFNRKNIRSMNVKGEECLVSRDVYRALGYEEENGKKAIQNLVPNKYKLRFGDAVIDMNEADILLH